MATTTASGLNLSSTSPFLSNVNLIRWHNRRKLKFKPLSQPPRASISPDTVSDLLGQMVLGVGVGLPCTVMECGDVIYRSTLPRNEGLTVTTQGAALLAAAAAYLWATPGVAPGFFDMFVLAFLERLFRPSFRKVSDCQCRNWSDWYEVVPGGSYNTHSLNHSRQLVKVSSNFFPVPIPTRRCIYRDCEFPLFIKIG